MSSAPVTVHRHSTTARRFGYLVAAAVNLLLLFLVLVWPGWAALSFLTEEFTRVVGLLSASLVVGAVANLMYVVADPPWVRSLGQLVVSAFSLAVTVRLLQVFPFDFSGWSFDPSWLVRLLLWLGVVGTAIGIVTEMVRLVRDRRP
ncbi:MAG TPA: hypothetical protein VIM19_04535 [Actinomycetes bacterium]